MKILNHKHYPGGLASGILIVLVICMALAGGCTTDDNDKNASNNTPGNAMVEKVEVIHFYTNQQCYSCEILGVFANDTLHSAYEQELKDGRITFAHMNADDEENQKIVEDYGVTGSSLWIGVYTDQGVFRQEDVLSWYKLNDYEDFNEYFSEVIDKRLKGDLS